MSYREAKTALITGASSGIGEAYARYYASHGFDIILVARRAELLTHIAHHLEATHGIHAQVITADLSDPDDTERVVERIKQVNGLSALVNSAGFAHLGLFASVPIREYIDMIHCHNLALVRLIHASLPGMLARRSGTIINVSSIGAFAAKRGDAVYCATKAFITLFSESLQQELKGTGVRVQAICPGFILTGFHETPSYAGLRVKESIPRYIWNTPDELVVKSFKALEHNKVIYIPYFKNQLIVFLSRIGLTNLLISLLSSFFPHYQEEGVQ